MSLPSGFVAFADDLRQELFGKISIIGMYAREMVFFGASLPAQILRVAIATTLRWPSLEETEPVSVEIYFPDQPDSAVPSVVLTAEYPRNLPPPHEADPQPAILLAQVFEVIPLSGPGIIRVFVSGPSGRKQIGRLFVRAAESPALQAVIPEAVTSGHRTPAAAVPNGIRKRRVRRQKEQ